MHDSYCESFFVVFVKVKLCDTLGSIFDFH